MGLNRKTAGGKRGQRTACTGRWLQDVLEYMYSEPGTAWPNFIPGSSDYKAGIFHPAEDLAMDKVIMIDEGGVVF